MGRGSAASGPSRTPTLSGWIGAVTPPNSELVDGGPNRVLPALGTPAGGGASGPPSRRTTGDG